MACCGLCGNVASWTYVVSGDGDGVEFLDAVAELSDGGAVRSSVMLALAAG